ncbi:hypothetical protein GTR04_7073 [Trichophyton interdigitale]|nr:hypothetical protein GY631_7080 [Trichophyton interdigitale]KAG5217048.1 hypothetical protein GY632_6943 [Trichophyton interdigitale]KAG8205545.1 hypothetical protein GTR04_7073 [Trichophyton interdigitale]
MYEKPESFHTSSLECTAWKLLKPGVVIIREYGEDELFWRQIRHANPSNVLIVEFHFTQNLADGCQHCLPRPPPD